MNEKQPNEAGSIRPPADLNPRRDPVLDFPYREFGEMSPAEYDTIGFMAGLEVHQQLLTESKLFCRCPAGHRASQVDAEVLRHMRPTLSELGEYDGTALMEFKTKKEIVYRMDRRCVCTYELDDTPPFEIDQQSVRISLEVCRLLDLDLVSELHVMRKQYLDGSIPTGFQRTAMVGLTGSIPFRESQLGPGRQLRIRQLSLEEDSCREVSDIGHRIVFLTDRLGMPLIETVTEPDLLTPVDVRSAGRLLARVARCTGKIRRGPGAARQDVNVSVAGGRRVEIKGVSHHKGLPQLVHIEAFRQLELLRLRAELLRRGVTAEMLALPDSGRPWEQAGLALDVRSTLRHCDFAPVRDALDNSEMICAIKLPGFGGLLAHHTQPGITFAREIRGRLRVIACLTARPFMIHSDLDDYGLTALSWRHIRSALKAEAQDAVIVVWGPADDVDTAAREALIRAAEALEGVPAETRQAFADGTTDFERILPGPDRMYPDTDTPPVPIPDTWVEEIELQRPETPWSREDRYVALGLDEESARRLAGAPWGDLFDALAPRGAATARRLAHGLEKRLVHFFREMAQREIPDAARLRPLVEAMDGDQIDGDGFEAAFDRLLREKRWPPEQVLEPFRHTAEAGAVLERPVAETVEATRRLRSGLPEARLRWAMGQLMRALRGRVSPRDVLRRLRREMKMEDAG